jgi:hypothetical protein
MRGAAVAETVADLSPQRRGRHVMRDTVEPAPTSEPAGSWDRAPSAPVPSSHPVARHAHRDRHLLRFRSSH